MGLACAGLAVLVTLLAGTFARADNARRARLVTEEIHHQLGLDPPDFDAMEAVEDEPQRIEEDDEYIYFFVSAINAHVVQKAAFPSQAHAQAFLALAHNQHTRALQLEASQVAGYLPGPSMPDPYAAEPYTPPMRQLPYDAPYDPPMRPRAAPPMSGPSPRGGFVSGGGGGGTDGSI